MALTLGIAADLATSSPALLAETGRVVLVDGGTITAEAPRLSAVRQPAPAQMPADAISMIER